MIMFSVHDNEMGCYFHSQMLQKIDAICDLSELTYDNMNPRARTLESQIKAVKMGYREYGTRLVTLTER